jgi:hypothetical protein
MRYGSSLTLIAVGAILMFAVRAEPRVLDLHVVGFILVLVGCLGMFVNHVQWERRRQAAATPPDVTIDPEDTGTWVHTQHHSSTD